MTKLTVLNTRTMQVEPLEEDGCKSPLEDDEEDCDYANMLATMIDVLEEDVKEEDKAVAGEGGSRSSRRRNRRDCGRRRRGR